jgi:GNAT superfamily N-acetyltransferase
MIRRSSARDDLAFCVEIKNAVDPDEPVSVDDFRPDAGAYLLHEGGGYAFVACSSLPGSAFAMVRVRPDARRQGIGSALLAAAAEEARTLEADAMWGRVKPDDEASFSFVRKRGFEEFGRDVMLVRELASDEGEIPAGIVELGGEHREAAYAVAVECTPDMAIDPPARARPYDEWEREELHGAVAFVALDGDRVVGYATLQELKAQPHRLEHGMTAVLRSHRGRGLAQALKRAEIAWAAGRGYLELVTYTQEGNDAMRAVNRKLGYLERPSAIQVRRSLP